MFSRIYKNEIDRVLKILTRTIDFSRHLIFLEKVNIVLKNTDHLFVCLL